MFARRQSLLLTGWLILAVLSLQAASAEALPRVVSINLCTDQLLLRVADREQILSISWLSADPAESMLARQAAGVPLNYGTAEEVLRLTPDVVIAGAYSSLHTQSLLRRLGHELVTIEPANDIDDISANLRLVAAAVGQAPRAEAQIAALHRRIAAVTRRRGTPPRRALVIRPGGFTTTRPSLPDSLLELAGYTNAAVDLGLDRWGSLTMESLLLAKPELIAVTDYRPEATSLANGVLEHPVLTDVRAKWQAVYIPGRLWACGLPDSLESVELMRDAIQTPRSSGSAESSRAPGTE